MGQRLYLVTTKKGRKTSKHIAEVPDFVADEQARRMICHRVLEEGASVLYILDARRTTVRIANMRHRRYLEPERS